MYLLFIHQIILFTSLYQFACSDHQSSIMTNVKDNETENESFNIIVRMISFGIQRTDDDEQKLIDTDLPETNNKDTQLLLLPLMIRMLFERISKRVDINQQSKDLQESDEIIHKSNTNKKSILYESAKRFITTTSDVNKVEKAAIIVFFILSFAVFLFTTFSIIHRLRYTRKFHIIRVDSSAVSSKNNHEESEKLLP